MGGDPDWNTKQKVSIKIVAQLREMTEDEQRAWLMKLLDHLDPLFVTALDFAYEVAPSQKRGSGND